MRRNDLAILKRNRFLMKPRAEPTAKNRMKYPEVALRVRGIRDKLGMSQETFAAACGISLGSITDYEQGRSRPGYDNIKKLEAMEKNDG